MLARHTPVTAVRALFNPRPIFDTTTPPTSTFSPIPTHCRRGQRLWPVSNRFSYCSYHLHLAVAHTAAAWPSGRSHHDRLASKIFHRYRPSIASEDSRTTIWHSFEYAERGGALFTHPEPVRRLPEAAILPHHRASLRGTTISSQLPHHTASLERGNQSRRYVLLSLQISASSDIHSQRHLLTGPRHYQRCLPHSFNHHPFLPIP